MISEGRLSHILFLMSKAKNDLFRALDDFSASDDGDEDAVETLVERMNKVFDTLTAAEKHTALLDRPFDPEEIQ